eukprot:TRINITY_DN44481_c0_g1_i1.p1 TRINITY_DN44481_c0_g1~~TRINITY_DN44481_c0_g1_i1.p1  ORF type:complete len:300 (-),score=45.00 TRINITY_DN44481_c0_g1_i1:214-1113(-)
MTATGNPPPRESSATAARRVLEEIAANGILPDADLPSYITVLTDYRRLCEENGWYSEAELVHSVLKQLRREEEMRHLLQLDIQQQAEMRGLQEAHMAQFRQFNDSWNAKLDAFDEEAVALEAALLQKHSLELGEFHALAASQPEPRQTRRREVIHLRAVERKLAKAKQYQEAARVKAQADALEATDAKSVSRTRDGAMARREAQLLARHRAEITALRGKVERNRSNLERQRREDLQQLLQRYTNVRRGLQVQQKILKARTATLLEKHNLNDKADTAGSQAVASAINAYGATRPASRPGQ